MSRWKPSRQKPMRKGKMVPVGIGNAAEQKEFLAANPDRLKAIESLYAAAERIFLRTLVSDKPADRIGFDLGRICVEEFSEILLLAGNGHGIGALKILRGMYERAVTSAYIIANPDQADAFLDYDKVNKRTAYMHAKKLGPYGPNLSAETIKRIEDEFEAVKPKSGPVSVSGVRGLRSIPLHLPKKPGKATRSFTSTRFTSPRWRFTPRQHRSLDAWSCQTGGICRLPAEPLVLKQGMP